jgi:hypothetical protein
VIYEITHGIDQNTIRGRRSVGEIIRLPYVASVEGIAVVKRERVSVRYDGVYDVPDI